MFGASMSNSTTLSDEASVSSGSRIRAFSIFSCNNNNSHSINTADNNATSINNSLQFPTTQQQPKKIRKKRSLPGNPDPDAEVIALSPKTLMATNRFVCEICNKGFQRDQNLQLHRRGHNLPWKLKQRSNKEVVRKRAYVCPEPTCVHHHPSRALGDLTGIKKHFCRKHGEKKWKCDKCSKIYAVQSDWKAHSKTCGTREYRCDCGTIFSRKDSFVTHRAFCDALAEESARLSAHQQLAIAAADRHHDPSSITLLHHHQPLLHINNQPHHYHHLHHSQAYPSPPAPLVPLHSLLSPTPPPWPPTTHIPLSSNDNWDLAQQNPNNNTHPPVIHIKPENLHFQSSSPPPFHFQEPSNSDKGMMAMSVTAPAFQTLHSTTSRSGLNATSAVSSAQLSATALLQKAATVGAAAASTHHHQSAARSAGHLGVVANTSTEFAGLAATTESFGMWRMRDGLTRDFLGLTGDDEDDVGSGNNSQIRSAGVDVRDLLGFTKNVELHQQVYDSNGGQSRYMKSSHHHGLFGFAENHHINSTAAASGTTWSDC